jgi:ribulose-bisphosphate carboxylase large chain
MSKNLIIRYKVDSNSKEIDSLARKIAIEQSVEAPESTFTKEIEDNYVPHVESILPVDAKAKEFFIDFVYQPHMLSGQYNQLLNLCFGNVSMYPQVRLVDIHLPENLLTHFAGPQFGIEGVRHALGVFRRPLLATALKPKGQSNDYFVELAYQFARGGGDILKDDQNLIGSVDQFKIRTKSCAAAVDKARQETGKQCLYFPFISAPFEQLEEHFEWVKKIGLQGVLLAPSVLGLDTARGLAKKYNLIYMAHPTFTGSYCVSPMQGMDFKLFYGLLYRLAGVDISVFPNQGGRFSFSREDCKNISLELQKPMNNIKPAFPCPAGGMQYEDLQGMCEWYGEDSVLLLGGSLLEYSKDTYISTKAFKDKIAESFTEENTEPSAVKIMSSCEISDVAHPSQQELLKFNDFRWQGRERVLYKDMNTLPFDRISRTELIGKSNEQCAFDLRYFEIESDGYSSLEKHEHTHVIIVARGEGEILLDERSYRVAVNDIVYIKPLTTHQLKNTNSEAFGFYCIVNRDRDKPMCL